MSPALHSRISLRALTLCACAALALPLAAQPAPKTPAKLPWMNKALSPDERAAMVIAQMTLDEKIQLVHGVGWGGNLPISPAANGNNGGAGYVPGIERLGIPGINMADSAVGVALGGQHSRYSTLLPSTLGAASSWNPQAAYLYGQVIGRELRAQGYNMSIGGGVDLAREPRNGRNFEYAGEDPLLAGTMVGQLEKGVQSQQIMGDVKHYALNDQEIGRTILNAKIGKRAMRESDLLAFQTALGISHAAGVMCSYNIVNGDYACENDYLLNQALKHDFGFQGWVMSDWGGTHSTAKAANAGLDMEMPGTNFFGDGLKQAVQSGQVPQARLDDMVHRILRSMFAVGVIDNPPRRQVVDVFQGLEDAQRIAEQSIVLLRNAELKTGGRTLPLSAASLHSVAIIGAHADVGLLSGGGSAQVDPPGGNAVPLAPGVSQWGAAVYFPSSPLKELQKKAPHAKFTYDAGTDPAAAAKLAADSQIAIVFVEQHMSEGRDAPTLMLPGKQNELVEAVAAANSRTIVVLETGGPVALPWADKVAAVFAAWYPGIRGAQALASLMFGEVNPSAKLPVSFARADADLPHATVPGSNLRPVDMPPEPGSTHRRRELPAFDVNYAGEGPRVGYKWFESTGKKAQFPFGFGLSYTTYSYSALKVDAAAKTASFTVKNTGSRPGVEIAQLYAALPAAAGENFKRLVAFERVPLKPGEARTVTLTIDPLYLSIFDEAANDWQLLSGDYRLSAGPSSDATPLTATLHVAN
ncbi:MAG: beta-glucosidase family protein [Bryobacteraceae bacterium]